MKSEEKEIIMAFLGETLNLPTETVTSLFEEKEGESVLKTDAKKILKDADIARVAAFKTDAKTQRENAYSKAKSETLNKFEEEFKAKYSIESEKKGLELFEEFISAKTADTTLTADKLKVHPEFLKIEKEAKKAHKEELEKAVKELEDYKNNVAQEKVFSNVSKRADEELMKLKPILSKDPAKAAKQKEEILLKKLQGYTYQENGDELIVMKDGKRLEDVHGKPVSFESLVKETAGMYFDFEEGGSHSSPGAENGGNAKPAGTGAGASKKWNGRKVTNDAEFSEEFNKLQGKEDAAEQRSLLLASYEEHQAAQQ